MNNEKVVRSPSEIVFSWQENKIMTFAGRWMELEAITQSEETHTPKEEHCMFSLYVDINF